MNLTFTDISFSLTPQLQKHLKQMLKMNEKFIKLSYVVLIIRKVTNMTGNIPYELQFTLRHCLCISNQLHMEMSGWNG